MIRVVLPQHLQTLAKTGSEVTLEVAAPVTTAAVLDALEARYPMLCGTVRDHGSNQRRDRVRFFADGEDVTHVAADTPLPETIANGLEPFMIIGAIAGG